MTDTLSKEEVDQQNLAMLAALLKLLRPGTIVGVDEVGRGALAGPIVAAAAAVSIDWKPPKLLTDSKRLSPARREQLFESLKDDDHVVVGIGEVSAAEIDKGDIDAAQADAQAEAIRATFYRLAYPPFVVVDGMRLPAIGKPDVAEVVCLPRADRLVPAVSLASVFAKVVRDRLMVELSDTYKGYGFAAHKGYGVKAHMDAIERLGPCEIHRRSFRPFKVD